jgi:hypothetical protein
MEDLIDSCEWTARSVPNGGVVTVESEDICWQKAIWIVKSEHGGYIKGYFN